MGDIKSRLQGRIARWDSSAFFFAGARGDMQPASTLMRLVAFYTRFKVEKQPLQ